MNTPLISVVLPVYNVVLYIKEAIDSILNQTIQDFEILVIDDCSTDDTLKVVKDFKDDRIRIIEKQQNKGLIDSLNIGFKEAKGKFIARMDGDDINVLIRFEKQLNILQNNPDIKACGCWLQCFGASSKIIKHKQHHNEIQARLLLSNPMSLGASMLHRESYKSYGFDDRKVHAEDYDFWARTAWESQMYNIQEVLYYYRTHEEQVSTVYKNVQLNQDITIKLNLYHKINYNKIEFSDAFLRKMLFSNNQFSLLECKQFFKWLNDILKINKKQKIFGNEEFKEVIKVIRRGFVFDIFFTNKRQGVDYMFRKEILKISPFNEKCFVIVKKLKERVTPFKQSLNKR